MNPTTSDSGPPEAMHELNPADLAARLVLGNEALPDLAQGLGVSLEQLAAAGSSATCEGTLRRLARLADLRTWFLVSTYRMNAAVKLIDIATHGDEKSDLARKACVDLLELRLPVVGSGDLGGGGDAAKERPVLTAEAQAAVQRLFTDISGRDGGV